VVKSDPVKPHEKTFIYAPFLILDKLSDLPLTLRGVSARLCNMILLVPTRTATQVLQVFTGWLSWILLSPTQKTFIYAPLIIMDKLYNVPLTWRGVSARLCTMIILLPTLTATQVLQVYFGWVSRILLIPMKNHLYMPLF
jgi:hypothetical protein